MSDINQEIAEEIKAERARIEREKLKPKPVSRSQVKEARYVWVGGIIIIDVLTAYLIYEVTTFWYYALIWAASGAGGLLLSERFKERVGNNKAQSEIAARGVAVSAFSVLGMALISGAIWIANLYTSYLFILIEASAVGLFFFHLWQSYMFQHLDDGYIADNEEARLEEANDRKVRGVHRAARIVESRKLVHGVKNEYRKEHGEAFDAVVDKSDPN